ncbi:hypothetical protein SM033_00288 [Vibrio phage vB_VpaM_sm033]|nr:hypothetical protein SM033_00288 [Vibrio phage vB_VpaM_sm033]
MATAQLTNKDALEVAAKYDTGYSARKLVACYHETIAFLMERQQDLTLKGIGVFRFKKATAKRHAYISFKPSRTQVSNDPAKMTQDTPFDEMLFMLAEQLKHDKSKILEDYAAAFLAFCALTVAFKEDAPVRIINGGEFRVVEKYYGVVRGKEVNGVRYVFKHHLTLKKDGDTKPGPSKRHQFGKK